MRMHCVRGHPNPTGGEVSVCNCYCSKCGTFGNGHCENCEVAMSAMQERDLSDWFTWLVELRKRDCWAQQGANEIMAALAEREARARREAVEECLKEAKTV